MVTYVIRAGYPEVLRPRASDSREVCNHLEIFLKSMADDNAAVKSVFGLPNIAIGTGEQLATLLLCTAERKRVAVFLMELVWTKYKKPQNFSEYVDLMINFLTAVHHAQSEDELVHLDREVWNLAPMRVAPVGSEPEGSLAALLNASTGFVARGTLPAVMPTVQSLPDRSEIQHLRVAQAKLQQAFQIDVASLPGVFPEPEPEAPIQDTPAPVYEEEEEQPHPAVPPAAPPKNEGLSLLMPTVVCRPAAPPQTEGLTLMMPTVVSRPAAPEKNEGLTLMMPTVVSHPAAPEKNEGLTLMMPTVVRRQALPPNVAIPPPGALTRPAALPALPFLPPLPEMKVNPAPARRTRQFFWEKLPDEQRDSTIWRNIDDAKIDLDVSELITKFQVSEVDDAKTVYEFVSREKVSNFAPLRMVDQNTLAADLLAMSEHIPRAHLTALRGCLPDRADFDAISSYDGPKESLGECERFFLSIKHITLLPLRVELLLAFPQVEEDLGGMMSRVDAVQRACGELRNSRALQSLLGFVLKIGNFLNGGSTRGGAFGFRINLLTKLADVVSVDPRLTLMDFIAAELPDLARIEEELEAVVAAATVDMEEAKRKADTYSELLAKCRDKRDEMVKLMSDDGLAKFVERFVTKTDPLCREFTGLLLLANQHFGHIMEFFGESAMKEQEFFGVFTAFIEKYKEAVRQNRERTHD
jgi:hypothetical protein